MESYSIGVKLGRWKKCLATFDVMYAQRSFHLASSAKYRQHSTKSLKLVILFKEIFSFFSVSFKVDGNTPNVAIDFIFSQTQWTSVFYWISPFDVQHFRISFLIPKRRRKINQSLKSLSLKSIRLIVILIVFKKKSDWPLIHPMWVCVCV